MEADEKSQEQKDLSKSEFRFSVFLEHPHQQHTDRFGIPVCKWVRSDVSVTVI